MQSHDEIAVPVSPEEVTLYVAIELSVKSWVILTIRMQVRRFTRLTNGFSKRVTNHALMVATYFTFYNFIRIHQTLRITPAMAAGVTNRLWEFEDLVEELNARAPKPKRPKTYKKRVDSNT